MPDRTSSVVELAPNASTMFFLLGVACPECAQRPVLTTRPISHKTESVSALDKITGDSLRLQVFLTFGMPIKRSQPAKRKPRADAQRNRERILEVAREAVTRSGAHTSLDDIA